MEKEYRAFLDRIVDTGDAVLFLEEETETVGKMRVDAERLPEEGQHDGAVFEVLLEDDELIQAEYLPDVEEQRRERLSEEMERIGVPLDELDPDDID